MASAFQAMVILVFLVVMVAFGPNYCSCEPAPPSIATQPFSFNILDGIKTANQGQNGTSPNGTMTGMYAYPIGGSEWQVVNYVADEKGLRVTSSKKVSEADLLGDQALINNNVTRTGRGINDNADDDSANNKNSTLQPQSADSFLASKQSVNAGNSSTDGDWMVLTLQPIPIELLHDPSSGCDTTDPNQNDIDQDDSSGTSRTARNVPTPSSDLLYSARRNCGYSPKVNLPPTQSPINPAVFGQFPWSVAILSSEDVFLCAATLISESIVVTTASCILNYQKTKKPLKAVVGAYSLPLQPQSTDILPPFQVYVKSAVVHPLYKADAAAAPSSLQHNIGLLRLVADVDFDLYPWIFPVCIIGPELEKQAGASNCSVIGWPELHNKNQPPRGKVILRKGDVTVSKTGCTASASSCINGPACNGNEGSEVICLAPTSKRYYQWGIVGAEPQCPGTTPTASVPTVSVIENYDFIAKYLWTSNPN